MTTPDAAMIFAAGFGTRMGDLTKTRPKPLLEVNGKALIDHTLDLLEPLAIPRICVNTHYLSEQVAEHLVDRNIILSDEQPEILDTGGGLKAALPKLNADVVFTANSDTIWSGPNPFQILADAWQPENMDALLLCVPLTQTIGRKTGGDFGLGPDGHVARGGDFVYGGFQILKTAAVAKITDHVFSLNTVWDALAQDKKLFGLRYPGQWCDVGHPEGLALAEQMVALDSV